MIGFKYCQHETGRYKYFFAAFWQVFAAKGTWTSRGIAICPFVIPELPHAALRARIMRPPPARALCLSHTCGGEQYVDK
jgi:hypothetical protein